MGCGCDDPASSGMLSGSGPVWSTGSPGRADLADFILEINDPVPGMENNHSSITSITTQAASGLETSITTQRVA